MNILHRIVPPLAVVLVMSPPLPAAPPETPANPECAPLVQQAREQAAARVTPLLKGCETENQDLTSKLTEARAGCTGGAEALPELKAAVRRLYESRTGDKSADDTFDPLAALARLESSLPPPASPAEVQALAKAREQVAALDAEIRTLTDANARLESDLKAALEAPKPPETPPLLTPAKLGTLIERILAPQKCDTVAVTVAETGTISVSATAGSEPRRKDLEERFTPIRAVFPDAALDLKVSPGGHCSQALNVNWSIIPTPDGRIRRVPFSDGIAGLVDSLPTLADCRELGVQVAQDRNLARYFAPDQTPLVWCRKDARNPEVGICKRAPNSQDWFYQNAQGTSYTGFPVVRTAGEPK